MARAHRAGLQIKAKQLFSAQTIAELAEVVGVTDSVAEQGRVGGAVKLTPIQRWFLDQSVTEQHYFNQALMLELSGEVEATWLRSVAKKIVAHHDALRLRFWQAGNSWTQAHGDHEEHELVWEIDLRGVPESERQQEQEAAVAELQQSLNLSAGPLLRIGLIELGEAAGKRMLVVIHHLVVDWVSWGVLLADFELAYQQLSKGKPIELGRKTTSFKQWSDLLHEYAQREAVTAELPYWQGQTSGALCMPVDFEGAANDAASVDSVTVVLSRAETSALLREVRKAYRTEINEVLLTALGRAYQQWTGSPRLTVALEGHGREEIVEGVELSRTVGWFTTLYPVLLEVGEEANVGASLRRIRKQLRAVPQKGMGYGLLRHLRAEATLVPKSGANEAPEPWQVSFNYLGQLDAMFSERAAEGERKFKRSSDSSGVPLSGKHSRRALLEVTSSVTGEQLHIDWRFSRNVHKRETIAQLADWYLETLRELIAHCLSAEAGGYNAEDFPLAQLSQARLDEIVGRQREIEDIYPVSPLQQGILFETLYAPGSGAYVVQLCVELEGELEVEALRQAFQVVVARYDILRSTFAWEGLEEPLHVVRTEIELPLVIKDWRDKSEAEQANERAAYLQTDRASEFDLSSGPLQRVCLINKGASRYDLIWSYHHIVMDGWSLPILLKEIFELYGRLRNGERVGLERRRSFKEYISWLRQRDMTAAEKFWRDTLKGNNGSTLSALGAAGAKQSPCL